MLVHILLFIKYLKKSCINRKQWFGKSFTKVVLIRISVNVNIFESL